MKSGAWRKICKMETSSTNLWALNTRGQTGTFAGMVVQSRTCLLTAVAKHERIMRQETKRAILQVPAAPEY